MSCKPQPASADLKVNWDLCLKRKEIYKKFPPVFNKTEVNPLLKYNIRDYHFEQ